MADGDGHWRALNDSITALSRRVAAVENRMDMWMDRPNPSVFIEWTGSPWDGPPTAQQAIDYLVRLIEQGWSGGIFPITAPDAHAVRVVKRWLDNPKGV